VFGVETHRRTLGHKIKDAILPSYCDSIARELEKSCAEITDTRVSLVVAVDPIDVEVDFAVHSECSHISLHASMRDVGGIGDTFPY